MNYALKLGTCAEMASSRFTRQLQKLASVGAMSVLTGCASIVGLGESEYACQGMPSGVQCMSTRDVYDMTNDGNVPRALSANESKNVDVAVAGTPSAMEIQESREAAFINTYVAPHLPDKPVPIRTPASVMRIWVSPWEDANGDLNATGYLYTEIEPRRWVIGDAAPKDSPVLRPLQVSRQPSSERSQRQSTSN